MKSEPDDPMFDVLLGEALGGAQAPDLSAQILAALANQQAAYDQEPLHVGPPPVAESSANEIMPGTFVAPSRSTNGHQKTSSWLPALAMAAGLLLAAGYFWWQRSSIEQPLAVTSPADQSAPTPTSPTERPTLPTVAGNSAGNVATNTDQNPPASVAGHRPSKPVQLATPGFDAVATSEPNTGSTGDQDPSIVAVPKFPQPASRLEDVRVIAMIDAQLAAYWKAVGVEPGSEIDKPTLEQRLAQWSGHTISVDEARPADSVRKVLQGPSNPIALARRLSKALLGPVGISRASDAQREALAEYLLPVISGATPFDTAAVELVSARGAVVPGGEDFEPAAVWYGALAGPRSVPLVEQFGHSFLDVDLRCGRCHDHPLDARVWQDQYWQLTATFETGLQWSAGGDGQLRVDTAQPPRESDAPILFYELADGRQRAAIPRPPLAWILGNSSEPAVKETSDLEQQAGVSALRWLTASLKNNPQVAKAAVNRAWEVVYGRPLVGSAANPDLAVDHQQLVRLQDLLADQLRAYDYDFGRLLSWIALSRPMRTEAPASLRWPAIESATDAELRLALDQVRAFAGFVEEPKQRPFGEMIAMASAAANGNGVAPSLSGSGKTALAQLRPTDSAYSNRAEGSDLSGALLTPEERLRITLALAGQIRDGQELPVAWLERVVGADAYVNRAEHLYYLAGYWNPSPWQLEAAKGLRESSEDDATALRRLWWVLQNSGT